MSRRVMALKKSQTPNHKGPKASRAPAARRYFLRFGSLAFGISRECLIDIRKILYVFELRQRLFVVAHEQERRAVFPANLADERKRFFRARAVEAAGGFVRQHELRPVGQGARHGHALLL